MNFDKEYKSEEFFFFFFGGGGGVGGRERERGGEEEEDSNRKKENTKNNRYSLIFCANVLQKSVKSHLNMDPTQSSEFQDPSSSNSLHIVLTRFFYFYKS